MCISEPMSKVSAVIVNYRSDQQTQSLVKNLSFLQKVTVIDNSLDNRGFAKATNIGILELLPNNDIILLINPDITFEKASFENFLENPVADICSPIIKFKRDNKWTYDFGGKINWLLGRPYHIVTPADDIDYVSGACVLVRRAVFEKIGFLDENFFLYFEDVDFCLRARKADFNVAVDQNFSVEHHIIEHRISGDVFKINQSLKSNWRFIRKWVPWYFWPTSICFLGIIALKSRAAAFFKS